jgi:hypothetical protein
MAGANSAEAADDAIARQAARLAVELSEADGPADDGAADLDAADLDAAGPDAANAVAAAAAGGLADKADGGLVDEERKERITKRLRAVTGRTTTVVTGATTAGARRGADSVVKLGAATVRLGADNARRGAATARRGADSARRGADSARRGAGSAGHGVTSGMNWLTAQALAMEPRLRIRDRATLRAQFPGQSDDEIAQRLIDRAARAAAAVGGSTGAWAALPALPAFPVEVALETLAVVGIEVKLVAELHEVYGMGATGSGAEKARAYLGSWAVRRGVYQVDGGLLLVAGSPLARQLTRRLAARVRRSTLALAPLFTGAVAGALLNRRETRRLGHHIRDELRQRRTTVTATVIR